MKKSKMVKIMVYEFYELNKDIFDDPDKRLNMLDVAMSMGNVLDKMEKEGMLPPFTHLKKLGTLDTAWEPEDE